MKKGRKQKLKQGAEYDLLYGRDIYCYLDKPGVKRSLKRQLNRRERREAKREMWEEDISC